MPETRTVKGFSEDWLPLGEEDFECRTFDLSDNSPYISSVIPAPEECKKNTQERYEIVKSEPAQSPVRRTFSADETAGASKNFESVPLWPLRYRSVSISARYSRRFQSTQKSFGEKSRRENIKVFDLEFWKPGISRGFQGDEIHRSRRNFESAPLWPLRYLSVYVKHGQNTLNLKKEGKPKC